MTILTLLTAYALGCGGRLFSFPRHPGTANLFYLPGPATDNLPGDAHQRSGGRGSKESRCIGFLSGTQLFAWINAHAGRSAVIAVRSVCGRLRPIRRTAWSGTLCPIGMKDKSVCIATRALDGSIILIMPRPCWDLIARRSSGTTSDLSSFQSCFRRISPSAGVAMLPRRSAENFRNWSCIAIGDDGW